MGNHWRSVLQSTYQALSSERDRGLYHELTLGSLRQWYGLKGITLPLLTKPLDNETLETCLYVGLYQVLCTRVSSACCNF